MPDLEPTPDWSPVTGRIPIMDVTPLVERGGYPAKAAVGEPFEITALVFREGHDQYAAEVVLVAPSGDRRTPVRMRDAGRDVARQAAEVAADSAGDWSFEVRAWSDPLATWLHDASIKIRAGVDVELMFTEGILLLGRLDIPSGPDARLVTDAAKALADTTRPVEARLAVAESPDLARIFEEHPIRELVSTAGPFPLQVDRVRALFSSWYEFFPRSEGARRLKDGTVRSGTFQTAAKRLPAVAAMGFDVIYLPPIHPIGEINRKGRNNTMEPTADDVGSPWAIGSKDGGHDAVHPDLGTLADFDAFVGAARRLGLEVALDFALQAAPDHPWVSSHPEWFTTRADGTIAYAENPPKKYQDIYPINFDNDPRGIYAECERVVRHWMSHGVRIFRVDNPHTKPVQFWEWLIGRIHATDPDVMFLSEAFTDPPMMQALAAVGFTQSYTYFTWRNNRTELESYLEEVSHQTSHVLRPNFFVNTPDILHAYLQYGGPAAFKIRAAVAATGSPSWGMYAGFELFEHVAVRPGSEEYLDSEKYQIRVRDWAGAEEEGRSLAPYITRLNEIRRDHPALQQLRNVHIHASDNDSVLVFSKTAAPDDVVIVVVNLDPHGIREATIQLDLPALGFDWGDTFSAHDEITGQTWHWGDHNYVRLDPAYEPAHIVTVRTRPGKAAQ